ncbi:MAG: hypothetical protein ACTSO9_03990 [Candidatus Helarchaeota archaeon]
MQVIETDAQTFIDVNPPSFPQLKTILINELNNTEEKSRKLFVLKENRALLGRIMTSTDPYHRNCGKKVGSFGWISVKKPKFLRILLDRVKEHYSSKKEIDIVRGPRNDPVIIGGQGVMIEGFNEPLLFGVSTNEPWLMTEFQNCGWEIDTRYNCSRIYAPYPRWRGIEDPEITVFSPSINVIKQRAEEIVNLYNETMSILPDVILLDKNTVIDFANFFKSIKSEDFLYLAMYDDKVIGIFVLLPNMYELWSGNKIQNGSWYLAAISKEHRSKFVFSKIYNHVTKIMEKKGISTLEAIYGWERNKYSAPILFQKGDIVRRHVMFSINLNEG